VEETVRYEYELIDQLILEVKKDLCQGTKEEIGTCCSWTGSPCSLPGVTSWGAWLEAAFYYCNNFEGIKTFVQQLGKGWQCGNWEGQEDLLAHYVACTAGRWQGKAVYLSKDKQAVACGSPDEPEEGVKS